MKSTTGKMLMTACATLAMALPAHANNPTKSKISDLAASLQSYRDNCAKIAKDARDSYSVANFKSALDRENAIFKARADARVYSVGHGNKQTAEYLAQQMKEANAAQDAKDKAVLDSFSAEKKKVEACVAEAEEQGRLAYQAFKQDNKNDKSGIADSLMAAWLANIRDIDTATHNGSAASYATWQAEKAKADVSSM